MILASGSPQRSAILRQLGVNFTTAVSGVEELAAGPPEALVVENAFRKASAVAADAEELVLGCDTVVALAGRVYGKPRDAEQAREMLRELAGRTHRVFSGVCLIEPGSVRTAAAVTSVTFRALDPGVIDWYLSTDEWRGRAGGYAIQGRGAVLVAGIEGDYLNVVGLPVQTLLDLEPGIIIKTTY